MKVFVKEFMNISLVVSFFITGCSFFADNSKKIMAEDLNIEILK